MSAHAKHTLSELVCLSRASSASDVPGNHTYTPGLVQGPGQYGGVMQKRCRCHWQALWSVLVMNERVQGGRMPVVSHP